MKLLHKILLATDFSKSAQQAMHRAIALAKIFNSEIHVLHVIPSMELSKLNREMIEKGVRVELKNIHDTIKSAGIAVHDIDLQVGIPFLRIIHEAAKHDVNVILMGSGEKEATVSRGSFPLGITAEKVLHKATKPVWIVKPESKTKIRRILCPVDFSKPAERAMKNAIHLARRMDAKLQIMHAVPSLMDTYLNFLGGSEEKQAEKIANHAKQLDKFLEKFDFHGVNFEKTVRPGKPHKVILETAAHLDIDLIIMGTSGESDSPKVLMGTNTKYVVRELPCSMVTVKSESVIQPIIDYQISDLESHYKLGVQFLENGMPQEAMEQFRYCVEHDVLFAPAWEGLALSHERLGYKESAEEYSQKAATIRDRLWQKRVESELRNRHEVTGSGK